MLLLPGKSAHFLLAAPEVRKKCGVSFGPSVWDVWLNLCVGDIMKKSGRFEGVSGEVHLFHLRLILAPVFSVPFRCMQRVFVLLCFFVWKLL